VRSAAAWSSQLATASPALCVMLPYPVSCRPRKDPFSSTSASTQTDDPLISRCQSLATRRSIRVSLAIGRSVFTSVGVGARLRTITGYHIANPNERRGL
jgi:hypothetical protein